MKKFSEEVEETLAGYRDVAHSRGMDEALREAVEMRVYYGRECAECRGIIAKLEAECDALKARFTAPIICFCGSTRFKQAWFDMKRRFTAQGYIVLDVGFFGHADSYALTSEEKAKLDELHKRKIDLADSVYVIDVGGYIGVSTRSEIAYAEAHGKPVRYLSREFPDYQEPVDEVAAERDALKARLAESEAQAAAMRKALTEAIAEIEYWHSDMLTEEERSHQRGSGWARVYDRIQAVLSSDAGRETAERLRLLEELLDLAAAFTENCAVIGCHSDTNPGICYDACLRKRLRIVVRKLKGGDTDARTQA